MCIRDSLLSAASGANLRELDVSRAEIGEAGAQAIGTGAAAIPCLRTLKLNSAALPIGELKTATYVDLSSSGLQLTDVITIAALVGALPR